MIGRSKEGRPLKAVISYDITDLRKCEIELDRKQKILEEAMEKQEYLIQFFENCPTMMGISELNAEGKITVKLANESTDKVYKITKRRGNYLFDGSDTEEEKLWKSKLLESKTTNKPVYFETKVNNSKLFSFKNFEILIFDIS